MSFAPHDDALFDILYARPMLALGGVAERCRIGPLVVFVFVWSTLVYDPIACWTWNPNGWSFVHGGLDFAVRHMSTFPSVVQGLMYL